MIDATEVRVAEDAFCSRCKSLGITTPTILAGEACIAFRREVVGHGVVEEFCCGDCFERLTRELEEAL